MEIFKVLVYLVLVCSVTDSSGLTHDNLQYNLIEMESTLKAAQESPDQKLDQLDSNRIALQNKTNLTLMQHQETIDKKLPHPETVSERLLMAMTELSNNLTTVQNQVNIAMKQDRELTTEHLIRANENLLEAIDHLNQAFRSNLTDLKSNTEAAIERHQKVINTKLSKQSSALEELNLLINKLITQQRHTNHILAQQEVSAKQRKIWKEIQTLTTPEDLALFKVKSALDLQIISFRSCKEEPSKESGKYLIRPSGDAEPFIGFCDQFIFGGGWLVIQHRFNGSLDFYRNWTEYRNGFGSVDGEYWLGLEYLHQMTSRRYFELLVELKDFEGNYIYARYDDFEISSESNQYALKLGSYSGTAGDSLHWHRNMKFTTYDQDNDNGPSSNCAIEYDGAWWYNYCHHSHLNGVYGKGEHPKYITWHPYKSSYIGLAYTRMLIRQL